MLSTRESLDKLQAAGGIPVIFADRCDNTGGGSPGDSTGMFQTFLDANLDRACILYIAQYMEAGVDATLDLEAGAQASPLQGKPCRMRAEVVSFWDGRFHYSGELKGTRDFGSYPTEWDTCSLGERV